MQGVCDTRVQFLDISIKHPGATSNYLAFMTSDLQKKVSTPGFLHPGLVLFGDNAYVSCEYMVTLFKFVHDLYKDAFNFFNLSNAS